MILSHTHLHPAVQTVISSYEPARDKLPNDHHDSLDSITDEESALGAPRGGPVGSRATPVVGRRATDRTSNASSVAKERLESGNIAAPPMNNFATRSDDAVSSTESLALGGQVYSSLRSAMQHAKRRDKRKRAREKNGKTATLQNSRHSRGSPTGSFGSRTPDTSINYGKSHQFPSHVNFTKWASPYPTDRG